MAEEHVATAGPLTKELVDDVVAFIRENERYWANQAATGSTSDPRKVAESALYEAWTDAQDHLQVKFAATLASHGIGADGAS